jgi:hypothetical protein
MPIYHQKKIINQSISQPHFIMNKMARERTAIINKITEIADSFTNSKNIGSFFVASVVLIVTIKVIIFQLPIRYSLPDPICTGNEDCKVIGEKVDKENSKNVNTFYIKHDSLFNNQPLAPLLEYRKPLLTLLGIIFPLIFYILNWYNKDVIRIMAPYFFLIGAQAGTMFVSSNLLGPGALTFVGLFYSSVRSLQLIGLRNKNIKQLNEAPATTKAEKNLLQNFNILLICECILWGLNALYLLTFIILVTEGIMGMKLSIYN